MVKFAVIIGASFIVSVITVILVLHISRKKSWYDHIDERKIHTGNIPRLGGIGFAGTFILFAAYFSLNIREYYLGPRFIPVLASLLVILFFGVWDDFQPMRPRRKLLVQILTALSIIILGYTFQRLFFSDIGIRTELGWLKYPLSFLWIVGITNAMNFIDGVDGLAGGLSLIIAISYGFIFSSFTKYSSSALLCFTLAASIGGFLVFNLPLPRARIFMGDGGSQFLGFVLAVLPLIDKGEFHSELPLPYAAALLSIPIFDTISAVWRRLRDGRRIDSPDKLHIHHKLMNMGLGARGVDGVLYSLQIILGLLVFFAVKTPGIDSILILAAAYLLVTSFFIFIHYKNRAILARKARAEG